MSTPTRPMLFSLLTLVLILTSSSVIAQPRLKLCQTKTATNDSYNTSTPLAPTQRSLCTILTVLGNRSSEYSASASANFPQYQGKSLAYASKCGNSLLHYKFEGWRNGQWRTIEKRRVAAKPTFDARLPYAKKIIRCNAHTGTPKKVGYDRYRVYITSQDGDGRRDNFLRSVIRRQGPMSGIYSRR